MLTTDKEPEMANSSSGKLGQKYGRTTLDKTAKHRQTNLTTTPTKSHGSR